jgi:hypothetical protein
MLNVLVSCLDLVKKVVVKKSDKPYRLFFTTTFLTRSNGIKCTLTRYFHTTKFGMVDIPGITTAILAAKSKAAVASFSPTPSAIYPSIDTWSLISGSVKAASATIVRSVLPSAVTILVGVVSFSFLYYLSQHLSEFRALALEYHQIISVNDGAYAAYLNTKYATLSQFNENSVHILLAKSKGSLTLGQCELLVRYYIENHIHRICTDVLVELRNGQPNLT